MYKYFFLCSKTFKLMRSYVMFFLLMDFSYLLVYPPPSLLLVNEPVSPGEVSIHIFTDSKTNNHVSTCSLLYDINIWGPLLKIIMHCIIFSIYQQTLHLPLYMPSSVVGPCHVGTVPVMVPVLSSNFFFSFLRFQVRFRGRFRLLFLTQI